MRCKQQGLMGKISQFICKIFGHRPVSVIEFRTRPQKHARLHRWEHNPKWNGKWVRGSYVKCSRCGKKMSNFRRHYDGDN